MPWRPTRLPALGHYLAATGQELIYVVRVLNVSGVDDALAALRALAAVIVPSGVHLRIECGNEMYDATRADVLAAYPTPSDYARVMAAWSASIKTEFPASSIAWVGLANDWDDRTRAWNKDVFQFAADADAATVHLYPGLPAVNASGGPSVYASLLAGVFPLVDDYAAYTDASIPSRLRLWVTEAGTWGNDSILGTWLQGLWHATFALLVPLRLPRIDVMLPYCAVCGDPSMPSYTTDAWGSVVPPNVTVPPGAWRRTPSGHGYSLAFAAAHNATSIEPLAFSPNPVLDSSTPSSRTLVGMRATDALDASPSLILINLGETDAQLDLAGVDLGGACDAVVACASTYSPRSVTDVARPGLRVEDLVHTVGIAGPTLALPGFSVALVACVCPSE